jgi:2-polyprenyl-3-methyl-5-hydroxy-6-metoxy-1,4-benzoquinol methylase
MEFKIKSYVCSLCNKDNSRLLLIKQGFFIVQCANCNFVYVNPRLDNSQLAIIYKHNYFKNKDYGYVGYEQEKRLRIKNFERWLKDAESFVPNSSPIKALDVGCAAGYCLQVMKAKGWNVEGLELDEEMCNSLENAGETIYHCSLESFGNNFKYHVITLFDVIEHIPNIDEALKTLRNFIETNGIIVMVTPNYNSLQRRLFSKKWFQYKPIEHIQYFTRQNLEIFAKRNNLQLVYHKKCGQYADTQFLINRLKYYRFPLLSKVLDKGLHFLNLKNRLFYTDTGSLYVIFKKM